MWNILGIEPTTNEQLITQAYRTKLMNTNPEADPEGFKALREAYENALEYARNNGEHEATPVDEWIDDLDLMYSNIKNRMNIENWKELLSRDICKGIDTRSLIEDRMIQYFYDHYYLSHEIWLFLNDEFSFMERLDELNDKYDPNFVEYVIKNGVSYTDTLPYEYFEPGTNGKVIEEYLVLYRKAMNSPHEERQALIDQLNQLSEKHLYGDLLNIAEDIQNGKNESYDQYDILKEKYPEDDYLLYEKAKAALFINKADNCEEICNHFLSINPDDHDAEFLLARCYHQQGKYKEAIEKINALMNLSRGDDAKLLNLNDFRTAVNNDYIDVLSKQELDGDLKIDLGWAYLQNGKNAEAKEVITTINKDETDPFDYYNLMSYFYLEDNQKEMSIDAINNLIEIIKNLKDDGTEKTQKRMKRLDDMIKRKADILVEIKKYDEAISILKQLIEEKHYSDSANSLTRIYLSLKNYVEAYNYAKLNTELAPENYSGYLYLSTALFHLGYDKEAYDAINESLNYYGYDLRSYVLKARILIRNNMFEEVEPIMELMKNSNLEDDLNYLFIQGLLYEFKDQNYEQAEACYERVCDMITDEMFIDFNDDAYYRLLNLKGTHLNGNNEDDRKIMFDLCNKGLSFNPEHTRLLDYKAWLYTKARNFKEALMLYHNLEQYETHPIEVESQLAYIYYQDLDRNAHKALEYCNKVLEVEEDPEVLFKAGMSEMYIGDYDNALKHFDMLEKHEWFIDSYYRKSEVYADLRQYDKAIEYALKTVELVKNRETDSSKFFTNVANLYCRNEQYDEAIQFILDHEQYPCYKNVETDLYDAYMLTGRYDELLQVMKAYAKKGYKRINSTEKKFNVYLTAGNIKKATNEHSKVLFEAFSIENLNVDYEYLTYIGNYKGASKALLNRIKYKEKNDYYDLSIEYSNLAFIYYLLGKTDLQLEYANKTIDFLNKQLELTYGRYKPLYHARLAKALVLANRVDEYQQHLDIARTLPPCEFCRHCKCKDADEYEIDILILLKKYDEALALIDQHSITFKDETRFNIQRSIIKKVKK